MLKMLCIFSHLNIKMATQKFTNFDNSFLKCMLRQYKASKIVSNKVKDN